MLQQGRYDDVSLALCIKAPDSGALEFVGNVKGKDAIIIGGTITSAQHMLTTSKKLKAEGARKIYGYGTHGIFSGDAAQKIEDSELEEILVSNTIPLNSSAMRSSKINQLTLAPLLAEAIRRIHERTSISSIFKTDGGKGTEK